MSPEETGRAYDRIAERWEAPDFDRTNGIAQHERALAFLPERAAGSAPRALDVGCGSSGRFVDLLLARGFAVEGLDVSAEMVARARRRHPDVPVHHADVCRWPVPHPYAFVTAWDSIWHVPLAEQEPLLRKLCGALAPGGVLVFTTGGLDGPDEHCDASMGPEVYYAALGLPRTLAVLAEAGCVCRHLEYDQPPGPHVYLVAQRPAAGGVSTGGRARGPR